MTGADRGLHAGVAVLRVAAWAWLALVTIAERERLGRPGVAVALLVVTVAWSAAAWAWRLHWPIADLAVGAMLLGADRFVYDGDHPQGFGGAWPVVGAISAGLAWGPWGGAAGGVVLGLARAVGTDDAAVISLVSSGVLYALAGATAGLVVDRLRRAETEVAAVRAREEVARTLHDGVLQTLAVVQRRSGDAELARLAREQERDLREWLFGAGAHSPVTDLPAALRAAAARAEDLHRVVAQVVVAEDLPRLTPSVVGAIAGAVGEALTNAAKHGGARRATVYVEPAGSEVFVSVKDDGVGFEAGAVREGVGTSQSIRGRIEDVGGRVEIDGNPGRGTEVRLWVSPS